jgi:hemolysin-activating ACP:hemolysin acyltransferase
MIGNPPGSKLPDDPTAQPPPASGDATHRQATMRSRAIAASLGGIVSILMRSKEHRHIPIGDLEALIGPAIAAEQFAIAEARDPKTGFVAPVAFVTWATVSADVDRQLTDVTTNSFRLSPADWRSGPIPWIMTAAGDRRATTSLIEQIIGSRLGGNPAKFRARDETGQTRIAEMRLAAQSAAQA